MVKSGIDKGFKTVLSTYQTLDDVGYSDFKVDLNLFPHKFGNGSYSQILNILGRMTMMDTSTKFMIPYLYTVDALTALAKGEDPFKAGLIHVTIGSWFHAHGLFMTDASTTVSTIVDSDGKPLFAELSCSFQSYKVLNADEYSSWWKS